MRTTAEIREGFLSFFESKEHRRVPSAPLVPRADDHTTLLTTAGMQPQMPYFLGREPPPAPLTTTAQKCFRTVDIDDAGLDTYHLTFFELLGNFPCGPDSELYYDWGEEAGCGAVDCLPGCTRCERFLEFWNLVFMEYELHPDGTLTPLPQQNIDTGLGLERTARILQDVPSVYETDGYTRIMDWIRSSAPAIGDDADSTKALRVLADHGRGMTFITGEGVAPSNEGRGYVLRRIIRRAAQHGLRV